MLEKIFEAFRAMTTNSLMLICHTTASTESARARRCATSASVLQFRRFPGCRLLLLCRAHL
jgi:hypothetical protein